MAGSAAGEPPSLVAGTREKMRVDRPSSQLLLQQDARGLVVREQPLPAPPSEDSHGLAVFRFGVALEAGEQRQPFAALAPPTSDDGAEPHVVDRAQLRYCCYLDRRAVPSDPDERTRCEHRVFNVLKAG